MSEPQNQSAAAREPELDTEVGGEAFAETRAFDADTGPEALSADTPAELLMDDEGVGGGNTAPQATASGAAEFETLGDTGAQDGAEAARPLQEAAGAFARDARSLLQGKTEQARAKAQEALGRAKDQTAQQRAQADAWVREKPYAALGLGVVAGIVLSGLLRRR